jgi:hypothetical protein
MVPSFTIPSSFTLVGWDRQAVLAKQRDERVRESKVSEPSVVAERESGKFASDWLPDGKK